VPLTIWFLAALSAAIPDPTKRGMATSAHMAVLIMRMLLGFARRTTSCPTHRGQTFARLPIRHRTGRIVPGRRRGQPRRWSRKCGLDRFRPADGHADLVNWITGSSPGRYSPAGPLFIIQGTGPDVIALLRGTRAPRRPIRPGRFRGSCRARTRWSFPERG